MIENLTADSTDFRRLEFGIENNNLRFRCTGEALFIDPYQDTD